MSNDTTTQAIERFYNYFKGAIESVAKIGTKEQPYSRHWKEIAYVVLLDSFSKFAYPQENGNRIRFTQFIKEFTNWEHQNRVSLPHVVRLLDQSNDSQFNEVKSWSIAQLGKWTKGWTIYLDSDPCIEDLLARWPKAADHKEKGQISPEWLTHSALLYRRRNALVHEFTILGHAINFLTVHMPYYVSETVFPDNDRIWERWSLGYPSTFLENLCVEGLDNLVAYFQSSNIDPQEMFSMDTYWIDTLREK